MKEIIVVVVGAIIVSSLLRAFVGQMFIIPSGSMENTLRIGDRVVVQKITDFHRGDVVVFADPGGWMGDSAPEERSPIGQFFEFVGVLPDTSTEHLIKRVIGMPGDTVVCCDSKGRITVNDQPLDERSYLYSEENIRVDPSDIRFRVVVPAGRIFVMGDHRDASADSRCHLSDLSRDQAAGMVAFVPIDLVVGRAFAVATPLEHAHFLDTPKTFAQVPPPSKPAPSRAVIKPKGVTC
ncbi:signal peptidase I [Microlunatus panaciterrae]|uniref:Signal peptidase I n=1 Tax=Microlunatus panaciterrae TaxID=400768 RepID=A0ABS2RN13_9ACTN|nr:signal peptidase I [Microlunatus panaciterrae]